MDQTFKQKLFFPFICIQIAILIGTFMLNSCKTQTEEKNKEQLNILWLVTEDMGVFFNFTLTFGSSFGRVRIILIKTGHNFLRCTVKLWSRPLQVNHLKKEPMLYYKILISRVPDPKFSFRNTMETWRAFWFGPSKASEFENSAVSIQFSLDV